MLFYFNFSRLILVLLILQLLGPLICVAQRTAICRKDICSNTLDCELSSLHANSYKYCSGDEKSIRCRDCRLREDAVSLNVHISGVQDHTKLQGYPITLLEFVNIWCPKIGCNVLYFKDVPKLSRFSFFTYPGVWDMATTTLIADNIHTKLYFIKYIRGRAIGAVNPIDIARLLSTDILRKALLNRYGVVIKTDVIDVNYKSFIDTDINDVAIVNDKNLEPVEDEKTKENSNFSSVSSLNARIMVLILFGVLLFTVFVSIALFKIKPRCLRHFRTLQRTSSTQDVIQDTSSTNDLDIQPSSSSTSEQQHGVTGFLQPPPYTDDDKYRKDNPPPKYDELFIEENLQATSAAL